MGNAACTLTDTRELDIKLLPEQSAIELNGIRVVFSNGFEAVRGISLSVSEGEALAVTGANGSGKSTLLRAIVGLSPLVAGEVTVFGKKLNVKRRSSYRKVLSQIGFIFQYHNLVTRLSVLSNVLHGAQSRSYGPRVWFQGLARQADREEALHCLDMVGLADQAGKRADELSGGQAQRVAVARALMQRPKILIADEPAASLDPKAGEEVMALFYTLCKQEGITLLFSSHDLEHTLQYSDRIVGLKKGLLELDDSPENVTIDSMRQFYE